VDLGKWFAFREGGTYKILGSYYMEFCDPEGGSYAAIWEDYVTAEFSILVEEKK